MKEAGPGPFLAGKTARINDRGKERGGCGLWSAIRARGTGLRLRVETTHGSDRGCRALECRLIVAGVFYSRVDHVSGKRFWVFLDLMGRAGPRVMGGAERFVESCGRESLSTSRESGPLQGWFRRSAGPKT